MSPTVASSSSHNPHTVLTHFPRTPPYGNSFARGHALLALPRMAALPLRLFLPAIS